MPFNAQPSTPKPREILIVGQGLAGSLLAMALLRHGLRPRVVEDDRPGSASLAAAGITSPVTGPRLARIPLADQVLPAIPELTRDLEHQLGRRLFHPRPIARLFGSEQEQRRWQERRVKPGFAELLGPRFEAGSLPGVHGDPLGGFHLHQGGWWDLPGLLSAVRERLKAEGLLSVETVDHADFKPGRAGVRWAGRDWDRVVFCEGHRALDNPWFARLPYRYARGEVLTLRSAHPLPRRIIAGGKGVLPLDEHTLRVGATFHRADRDTGFRAGDETALLETAARLLGHDRLEVLDRRVGVRCGSRHNVPFVGAHPSEPRLYILNGLGSKGTLQAPYYAQRLADHLARGTPLPRACALPLADDEG
ncbi:NAD(P)/FAD-dependent oxidoreductase [Alkalilimnicola ehrlichii MLHE-1]|uniref:FAD dependent oxidoreductase n=1 Tax=Alkalilimnicola ehrlichii (strain ATCC BAA-1101 / DSM 17681 / MLHE-1) TaxID=187272 RepID=Q0A8I7_ALKEH|nr:FAD-dependent oxidoreductase [Alkalilimnicola ehrlichii]ABI56850.1 FAD dependent oxidoreductase [Alkalilimnicola ehrlichii MLHE-1]